MNKEESTRPADAELVRRTLAGSSTAFTMLVTRYQGLVSGVLKRFGTSTTESADLVQDVFGHAYEVLGQLRQPERFAPWIYRLAVNRCVDLARQGQARQRAVEALAERTAPASEDPVLDAVSDAETRQLVREAVDRLTDDLKEVVYLRYYNGLTYDRIAELLDVPMTTIDGRLRRAKAQLMQELSRRIDLRAD